MIRPPFIRLLAIVLVLAAFATTPAAAQRYICEKCGRVIEGPHFETGGRYYHPEHFTCAHCGQPITGAYTEYKGENYHSDCFKRSVALRCSLCDQVIQGEYIQDYWGNAYCKRHKDDPCCDSCSRFISPAVTGGGVRYDDGRYICAICQPGSVKDIDVVMKMIDEVATHLASFGMEVDYAGLNVHLIGQDQMKDLSGEHSSGLRGFTDYSHDWRIFKRAGNRKLNVYFLYGMPRMELISTIAHELAHIYQFNHGRFRNDQVFAEGSCNYASWLVLRKYDGENAGFFRHSLTHETDPVYGDGFRRVRTFAETEGIGAWLERLRKKKDLPRGY
jgi:hypothetical protein